MAIEFADFDLSEIFGKPDINDIEIEYCLWVDVESAFED